MAALGAAYPCPWHGTQQSVWVAEVTRLFLRSKNCFRLIGALYRLALMSGFHPHTH